tara:strand:+ start:601 stop:792 length:192 start_codon:yes stop_codon:yes gene_type:complete
MRVPGQAGRWFAVVVAAPLLYVLAALLWWDTSSRKAVSAVLVTFATVFIVYEVLWLTGVLDYK